MRSLVLGAMPPGAGPDTHIASGPWCFTGREEAFPGWDRFSPLPPDPFPDPDDMNKAALAANAELLRQAGPLGAYCNARRGAEHSELFWQTALAPWLLLALHMLAEREARVRGLLELYGKEKLVLDLLPPDCAFSFKSTVDFMVGGVQDSNFNHYVFSRLIESQAPPNWVLRMLPARTLHSPPAEPRGLKALLRDRLRSLPFPRLKSFSLGQMLLFSLALRLNSHAADSSPGLAPFASSPPVWNLNLKEFLERALPTDYLNAPIPNFSRSQGRLRVMSPEFSQNSAYALELAAWRAGGGKLVSMQHGANSGNLAAIGVIALEYAQHGLITWGWTSHSPWPGKFTPLPHPSLRHIRNRHKRKNNSLILVGTEMSPFAYRLKSRPLALAQVRYRQDKIAFLRALPDATRANALYRPYFKVAGGLDDAPYVQAALPDIKIASGDLSALMLDCALLVLDHYGTTLLTALAANVPFLGFWRPEWAFGQETEQCFAALTQAGIIHPGPLEAAAKAAEVWEHAEDWWQSPNIQKARASVMDRYALAPDISGCKLNRMWFKELRKM